MNIFEGLQFCYDNPYKRIALNEKTCVYYDYWDVNFYSEIKGNLSTKDFDINEWPFSGEYKPVIKKQPLSELFSFWIDGGVVCCEIKGIEYRLSRNALGLIYSKSTPCLAIEVTPELSKQNIWWVNE